MYDVDKLKTPEECRTVLERAKTKGLDDVYRAVFRRYCRLAQVGSDDPSDPIVREFAKVLAAYEQILTEKNKRTTRASRTRQKIERKGVAASLIDWTHAAKETPGFNALVSAGLSELIGEYLVTKFAERFAPETVSLARARLIAHGASPFEAKAPDAEA